MKRLCQNCNLIIKVIKYKTVNYQPFVCNMECFYQILRTNGFGKDYDIFQHPEILEIVPVSGYRSLFESDFANNLMRDNIDFWYEPCAFDMGLVNSTCYIPDFYLPEFNSFIELKGRWVPCDRLKAVRFGNFCETKNIGFYTIDQNQYRMWTSCTAKLLNNT